MSRSEWGQQIHSTVNKTKMSGVIGAHVFTISILMCVFFVFGGINEFNRKKATLHL